MKNLLQLISNLYEYVRANLIGPYLVATMISVRESLGRSLLLQGKGGTGRDLKTLTDFALLI